MKKLYLLTIVMLLAGCSMLAPKFDNVEYHQFAGLNTHAEELKKECGTKEVPARLEAMKFWSATLLTYASHLKNNNEITQFITIIDNDIREILTRYENGMSDTYCEFKAGQLIIKLDRTLDSIGNLN